MRSANVSQSAGGRGVSAKITWDTGPEVYVTITDNAGYDGRAEWRIRGQNPDATQYCPEYGHSTNEEEVVFCAENGKTYMFQAVWNNVTSNGAPFTINFDGSGGDDSGDDSGGDSGDDSGESSGENSGSNSSIYPESVTQNGVTAKLTISGSIVTVKVSSTSLPWRINGTNSGGDHGTYYISENRNSSGSFTAENGHAYAFQVASGGRWSDGIIFYVNIGSGGGSSSGDDSGGSSSGNANSNLKEYEFTAFGVRAKATYTSGPEVTITILSWNGYSSIPYWRIKGRASQGDSNTYLSQTNASSASFNSYDGYNDGGKEYTFQVCRNGTWGNDSGENSVFLVDFSLSGGGSGGDSSNSYTIQFNEGEGTKLTVTRTSSTYGVTGIIYENGNIYYDDIWANDCFEIVVEAKEGYQLNELVVDGLQYANGAYTFSGNGNASITTSATLVTSARIFNKNTSSWNTYGLYIYNGSSWNRYRPYIYKGSSWNIYS